MSLLDKAIKECGMGMEFDMGGSGMPRRKRMGSANDMPKDMGTMAPGNLLSFLVRRNSAEEEEGSEEVTQDENTEADTITMDVPLLIRMLELAREEIKDDATLHHIAKKMIDLGAEGNTLDMKHYEEIISNMDLAKHDDDEGEPSEEMG